MVPNPCVINSIFLVYFCHSKEQNFYLFLLCFHFPSILFIDLMFLRSLRKKIFNKLIYIKSGHKTFECNFTDGRK